MALHALVLMATKPLEACSTIELADRLAVSRNHLVKVMQRLQRAGLLSARRGPRGGFILALPPADITLLQVVEVVEGRLSPPVCLLEQPICKGCCLLSDAFQAVNKQLVPFFERTTLADLAARLKGVSAGSR